jgi:hypothetical protein
MHRYPTELDIVESYEVLTVVGHETDHLSVFIMTVATQYLDCVQKENFTSLLPYIAQVSKEKSGYFKSV